MYFTNSLNEKYSRKVVEWTETYFHLKKKNLIYFTAAAAVARYYFAIAAVAAF